MRKSRRSRKAELGDANGAEWNIPTLSPIAIVRGNRNKWKWKGFDMDDLREDYEIFLIKCSHRQFLAFDSAEWCAECNEWVEGLLVGTVAIWVAEDGAIQAIGSGYVEGI
jgi:hypothetical protein